MKQKNPGDDRRLSIDEFLASESAQRLIDSSIQARTNSYSPYSQFKVGAAILDSAGNIHQGCNVENAVYGLAICAERVAVSNAISAGIQRFDAIAICAEPLATPCGSCRQVLAEFSSDLIVICVSRDLSERNAWTLSSLLPVQFKLKH